MPDKRFLHVYRGPTFVVGTEQTFHVALYFKVVAVVEILRIVMTYRPRQFNFTVRLYPGSQVFREVYHF